MKLDQLKIPTLKPRDPNQAVLAAKRNAGGAMRDKKHEWKRGEMKHRGRAYEDQEILDQLDESAGDEMKRHAMALKRDGNMRGYHKQMIKYCEHMIDAADFNSRNTGPGVARTKIKKLEAEIQKHRAALNALTEGREGLLESLEDNQAELAGEFDTLIAKAKRDGWKADRIAQYKKQFDALNRNFASAYYNDSDDDEDDAIESVLDSMEELLDELADELGELREGVEPRKLSGKRGTIEKRMRDAKLAKQREAEAEDCDYDDDDEDDKKSKTVTEKFHLGDAPEAHGKFKELGVEALAAWLIKTREGDARKIYGSINQQIVFNGKKDPEYAKKMKSVREAVKRKLNKKD